MEEWYPEKLNVSDAGTVGTWSFLQKVYRPSQFFHYAELGIYKGATAERVASHFQNATLHLFDFDATLAAARERLNQFGVRVRYYGNTQRYNDSYNWSLAKLIEGQRGVLFDYVFLDGAHTLAVDGLAFFLCDRLLRPGGFLDFDDYNWRLRGSSLDPSRVPAIAQQYTDEQIDAYQVKWIVDELVEKSGNYDEVVENKIFRKHGHNAF